jgi:hypothetical protein
MLPAPLQFILAMIAYAINHGSGLVRRTTPLGCNGCCEGIVLSRAQHPPAVHGIGWRCGRDDARDTLSSAAWSRKGVVVHDHHLDA